MDFIKRLFGRQASPTTTHQVPPSDAPATHPEIEVSRQPRSLPRDVTIVPWQVDAARDRDSGALVAEAASGELEALEPEDLAPVAIMAQALDNQWVPRALLSSMLKHPSADGLESESVKGPRDRAVRTEYIRALINGQQLVVNRAFMYNTSAVSQDYKPDEHGLRPASAESFEALLDQGVIVPYLLSEGAPADPPAGFERSSTGEFSFDPVAFREWRSICQEQRVKCVKFSWNEESNRTLANRLFANFETRIKNVNLPLKWGDVARYLADCDVPPEGADVFKEQLVQVGNWANAQDKLSRDLLYQRFIVGDGTKTWQGKYDPGKPFVFALKQLFDLDYAVNLTDELGLYTLTPIDSLSRTSLQELTIRARQPQAQGTTLEPNDLQALVRQFAFGLTQGGLYLRSMGDLTLSDVLAVRDTEEWANYMQSVQALLGATLHDPQGAILDGVLQSRMEAVYSRYERLMRVMTDYVTNYRDQVAQEKWTPLATLLIDIGGALVTAAIVPPTAGFGAAFVYGVAGNILQDKAGVVARMLIRGTAALGAQASLEASLDFMRAKLNNAKTLVRQVRGGADVEVHIPTFEEAGFTYVNDLGPKLTRLFDGTVNFPEDPSLVGA